jgi:hypothetical protein
MAGETSQGIEKRFDRYSILVLAFAILFLAYQVVPEFIQPEDISLWLRKEHR